MTLYNVSYFCGDEEIPCALFSDTTPEEVIMTFCDALFDTVVGCTCVQMTNLDTMQMVYEVTPCDPDWEPVYIDDDCGFDPYMGCYTDDC